MNNRTVRWLGPRLSSDERSTRTALRAPESACCLPPGTRRVAEEWPLDRVARSSATADLQRHRAENAHSRHLWEASPAVPDLAPEDSRPRPRSTATSQIRSPSPSVCKRRFAPRARRPRRSWTLQRRAEERAVLHERGGQTRRPGPYAYALPKRRPRSRTCGHAALSVQWARLVRFAALSRNCRSRT
jgi:hypothetical protein